MQADMLSYRWILSIWRQRCVPLSFYFVLFAGGASLPPVSYFGKKGGLVMVTLSELIQVGILVVGVIELVLHLIELDRHHRQ